MHAQKRMASTPSFFTPLGTLAMGLSLPSAALMNLSVSWCFCTWIPLWYSYWACTWKLLFRKSLEFRSLHCFFWTLFEDCFQMSSSVRLRNVPIVPVLTFWRRSFERLKSVNLDLDDYEEAEELDCKEERTRVNSGVCGDGEQFPLVIHNLHKIFRGHTETKVGWSNTGKPPTTAVKKLCLAVEKGECFGLLGNLWDFFLAHIVQEKMALVCSIVV